MAARRLGLITTTATRNESDYGTKAVCKIEGFQTSTICKKNWIGEQYIQSMQQMSHELAEYFSPRMSIVKGSKVERIFCLLCPTTRCLMHPTALCISGENDSESCYPAHSTRATCVPFGCVGGLLDEIMGSRCTQQALANHERRPTIPLFFMPQNELSILRKSLGAAWTALISMSRRLSMLTAWLRRSAIAPKRAQHAVHGDRPKNATLSPKVVTTPPYSNLTSRANFVQRTCD